MIYDSYNKSSDYSNVASSSEHGGDFNVQTNPLTATIPSVTTTSALQPGQQFVVVSSHNNTTIVQPIANQTTTVVRPFVNPANRPDDAPIGPETHFRRPKPNRWADGICDCHRNLFPSCYCVCCFFQGLYITAQMSQKTGMITIKTIMISYVLCWIFAIILELVFHLNTIIWLPMLFCFWLALMLRLHIIKKYNITEYNEVCECCWGFWCWYCSVAQMARHVYGYHKVLDGDSDVYRPDGYPPVQEV